MYHFPVPTTCWAVLRACLSFLGAASVPFFPGQCCERLFGQAGTWRGYRSRRTSDSSTCDVNPTPRASRITGPLLGSRPAQQSSPRASSYACACPLRIPTHARAPSQHMRSYAKELHLFAPSTNTLSDVDRWDIVAAVSLSLLPWRFFGL